MVFHDWERLKAFERVDSGLNNRNTLKTKVDENVFSCTALVCFPTFSHVLGRFWTGAGLVVRWDITQLQHCHIWNRDFTEVHVFEHLSRRIIKQEMRQLALKQSLRGGDPTPAC